MIDRVTLKVKKLPHCQHVPAYATAGSAGLDLMAAISEPLTLQPGQRSGIPTGLILEIPAGYEGQVRPRSGLAARHGITLTNCVGTIDSDYRGEVVVLAINLGQEPYTFSPGERVAQLVVMPLPRVDVIVADELGETERGTGGFGSTGRSAAVRGLG